MNAYRVVYLVRQEGATLAPSERRESIVIASDINDITEAVSWEISWQSAIECLDYITSITFLSKSVISIKDGRA